MPRQQAMGDHVELHGNSIAFAGDEGRWLGVALPMGQIEQPPTDQRGCAIRRDITEADGDLGQRLICAQGERRLGKT